MTMFKRRSSRRSHATENIESLEPRRLLATFDATNAADAIHIFRSGSTTHVEINGTDHTTTNSTVVVNAMLGNDVVTVDGIPSGTTLQLNADDGDDSLVNSLTDIDACYAGRFIFDGGPGFDSVRADNATDTTTAGEVLIQGDSLVTHDSIHLEWPAIESLLYIDSLGSNRIGFLNLQGPGVDVANVTINANAGDDFITNTSTLTSSGFWPTSIGSVGLTVNGGGGNDQLVIDASAGAGGTYTVTSTTLAINTFPSGAGVLTYGGCERFELVGSDGPDRMVLQSKPGATTMLVESLGGTDEFDVGGGDIDSRGFVTANTRLLGGLGNDLIAFDDHLDAETFNETETYNFDNFTVAKGSAGVTYGGFESQSLDTADIISGSIFVGNVVNLNAIIGGITTTTINGGTLRDNTINVGNGDLVNVSGSAITLNFNAAGGSVSFNDQINAANANYAISTTQFSRNGSLNVTQFSGASFITLNASAGANVISFGTLAPGCFAAINAGGGDDSIFLGAGNLDADLRGPVTVSGGPGIDALTFDNDTDVTSESQTLAAASFTDGFLHSFNAIESLRLTAGPGGGVVDLDNVSVPTTIDGNSGSDTVDLGAGSLNSNFLASVVFNGAGGGDSVAINGQLDSANNTYAFPSGNVFRFGTVVTGKTLTLTNVETETLRCGSGNDSISVTAATPDLRILAGGGNDGVSVLAGTVTLNTGAETGGLVAPFGDSININSDGGAPATVIFDDSDTVLGLDVAPGGTLRVQRGAVIAKSNGTGSTFNVTGVIDLAGGALLSRAGGPSLTAFRRLLQFGYNGGAWNGTNALGSINSSLAASSPVGDGAGYGLGSEIALTSIGPFNIGAGDTLIRHTLNGDADLNGVVDLADFNRLAANFGQAGRAWVHADSNYDGNVDLTDFNLLAANFGQSVAPTAVRIPELE
jgi:hypothetical protein